MANVNKPMGLSPVQYLGASSWNGQARMYSVAYNYASAIYIGDPVVPSGTADTKGIMGVTLATAGDANMVLGAVVGVGRYADLIANPNNLNITYYPANGDGVNSPWYVLVADDPNTIFQVQDTGASTAIAATDIGLNINLKSGTGNGFVSGWGIDNASKAATATFQCKLMGLVRSADNEFGQYAKFYVKLNNHFYGTGTGQAGI